MVLEKVRHHHVDLFDNLWNSSINELFEHHLRKPTIPDAKP